MSVDRTKHFPFLILILILIIIRKSLYFKFSITVHNNIKFLFFTKCFIESIENFLVSSNFFSESKSDNVKNFNFVNILGLFS